MAEPRAYTICVCSTKHDQRRLYNYVSYDIIILCVYMRAIMISHDSSCWHHRNSLIHSLASHVVAVHTHFAVQCISHTRVEQLKCGSYASRQSLCVVFMTIGNTKIKMLWNLCLRSRWLLGNISDPWPDPVRYSLAPIYWRSAVTELPSDTLLLDNGATTE